MHIDVDDFPLKFWAGNVTFDPPTGNITRATLPLNVLIQPSPSQAVVAHELGHVLLLAHDGLNPDGPDADDLDDLDQKCGPPRVPQTIMDYDCYVSFGVSAPVNWDFCGENHKFQSGGVWSGC